MFSFYQVPESGDPSNLKQEFVPVNISVLCCRYWWLEKWKCNKMSFPYWRLYWNKTSGAYVINKQRVDLNPDCVVLIPPYTMFETNIENEINKPEFQEFELVGNRVKNLEDEILCLNEHKVLHLFIHFNLGDFLDNSLQEIYSFKLQSSQKLLIDNILNNLLSGVEQFNVHNSISIYQLILSAVSYIPEMKLYARKMDFRIINVLEQIHSNPGNRLSNSSLAKKASMATNSFTRFFKEHLNYSPQEYIRRERIAKACNLLDHSNYTIDKISEVCGFSDRFHFSKVFKKVKGIAPAEYKKHYILTETENEKVFDT